MQSGRGDVASYDLGEWKVYPTLNRLRRAGEDRLLEPKVMRVLQVLAREAPEVVPRQRLMEEVWPQEYVTEHVLSRSISELRRALGDDARSPRYVETIRKGGYRLLEVPRHADAVIEPDQDAPSRAALAAPNQQRAAQSSSGRGSSMSPGQAKGRFVPPGTAKMDWRRSGLITALVMVLVLVAGTFWVLRPWKSPRADEMRPAVPLTSHPGSEVDPVLSPDGALLAFSWDGPDRANYDIYLQTLGESSPRRLTRHPGEDKNPVFFPDGRRIAFVRSAPGEEGIYALSLTRSPSSASAADIEAGPEVLLTRCNTGDIPDLALSPEGRFLYFSDVPAHGRPPSAIYRLDLELGRREAVTRPPEYAFGDRDLALSHDGSRLAFARAEIAGIEELFVTDLGSGRTRQLTSQDESIMGLSWTPEDREILFASSREVLNLLWSVRADGSAPARVLPDFGEQLHDPYLSRRTSRLVFEHKDVQSNLWRAERGGLGSDEHLILSQPLAPSTRWDIAPTVAPDGRIAFISTRSGYPALWTQDPLSGDLLRLTDASLLPGRPAWGPEGRWLIFSDRSRGQADLVRIDSAGGAPVRLTDSAHNEVGPSFSHDGRALYFGSDQSGQWQLMRCLLTETPASRSETEDGKSRGGTSLLSDPEAAASGGAIRGVESPDGRFLYFARHSRPGLWRKALPEGPESLVTSGPMAGAWMDWTLHGGTLYYLEHRANESVLSSLVNASQAAASPSSNPARRLTVPRPLYPGGGLALTRNGTAFYLTVLDRSESDILMAPWP
ncbi:MAG TPA: winged helix-turn-helix domain-containing protein [Acidobacteriota bacterium]|nr:winged helix-turn-helix domain-containing protein [Acidobacteriota bacterium]